MTVETRPAPHAGWRAVAATLLLMPGATVAHTWAGGHVPAWPGLVLLGAVVLGSSRLLLGGRLSPRLLLPAVVAAQAGLHTSFVALTGPAGHATHAVEGAAGGPTAWSGRMVLAHAAVALLTLLVWRVCDRAAATVVRVLALPASYVAGPAGRRPVTPLRPSAAVAAVLVAAPRRGPPVVARHA